MAIDKFKHRLKAKPGHRYVVLVSKGQPDLSTLYPSDLRRLIDNQRCDRSALSNNRGNNP